MSELINNREHRIETLKHIIKHLHAGEAPEQVKSQLAEMVKQTDASEIAAMEQELIAEGMPVEEVQSMCDLHSEVLRDFVIEPPKRDFAPGHPLDTFRRENQAISQAVLAARGAVAAVLARPETMPLDGPLGRLREAANTLMDVEKHYQRKEHLLFSCLERHGITGPSKVMWGKDDEVRAFLKDLHEALGESEASPAEWKLVVQAVAEPALNAVEEMVYKEENILFPMSEQALTDDEWAEIWLQSPEYGWCIIAPEEGYAPPAAVAPRDPIDVPRGRSMVFPSGSLSFEQLLGIFGTLPLDLTFVDADDRVAFFTEGPERIFPRSRAIVGRKVQHCHPPKSVSMVEQILEDFKSGTQSAAEFWIEVHGRFVHIRYFAVRDSAGSYLGTLEVSQDLTELRALEGERRLLEYAPANPAAP